MGSAGCEFMIMRDCVERIQKESSTESLPGLAVSHCGGY